MNKSGWTSSVFSLVAALVAALAGPAVSPGAAAAEASPGSQWPTYNNRLDGDRYSPLKQITAANAARLGEVCRVQVDGPTSFHGALIVQGGVIYTSTGRETYAIDAGDCGVRWKYSWQPEEERCGGSNRGVAVLDGRVFRGTCDGRVIALDAATGRLLWKAVIAAPRLGEGTAAAPLAWAGVVYMGISGSELGVRGRVVALDAHTGRELWRFNTVPMGEETGAETWLRPESARTGGGGVWGAMTLDVTTGELFVPVGNPWPDIDKAYRPGTNLFTNSIVALDARTGQLKWWYQSVPEDWMDFDLAAPPVLYRASGVRDLLVFGGKDGHVTALDRATRQPAFRVPVTTVQKIPAEPSREGLIVCPGYAGGVEWNGPALDRLNNALITGAVDACFRVTLGKTEYAPGAVSFGGTVEPVGETRGWITAIDADTGAVRWKYAAEKPVVAGITPTAGGVTFAGDLAGNFLVFDSRTGKVVHRARAGGAMAGGVVTYEHASEQHVAFAAGNISRNAFGDLGLPSVVILKLDARGPSTTSDATAATVRRAGGADVAAGRRLYGQVCVACHGPDGSLIADHRLRGLAAQRGVEATIAYLKDPKPPMPKLYPDLLTERDLADVTAFLHEEMR